MKLKLFAVFFLLLILNINVASAELSYYPTGTTTDDNIWINVSLNASSTQYYAISKTAGYSPSGANTFEWFDDFDNLSQFTTTAGAVSVADSKLILTATTGTRGCIESDVSFDYPIILETELYSTSTKIVGSHICSLIKPSDWNYRAGDLYGSSTTNELTLSTMDGGTENKIDGLSVNDLTDNHIYSISSTGLLTAVYQDNTILTSTSTSIPDDNMVIAFREGDAGYGAHTIYIDSAYVRQYASIEPTVNVTDMGGYYILTVTENTGNDLTNYQIHIDPTDIGLSSVGESLRIIEVSSQELEVALISPANTSITDSNILSYNLIGDGELNSIIYIDGEIVYNGSAESGTNQYNATLSEGSHSWNIYAASTVLNNTIYSVTDTWYFTYDSISPSVSSTHIDPDYDNIANGTIVQTNLKWSDTNLKNASFYVNYGSGYSLIESIDFSASTEWFNATIDTSGYTGEAISWYQLAYDKAGNSYTYSDSFNVVESALNIYVYDETTSEQILPSNVVIYNEDISKEATISESTKIASLDYNGLSSDRYIVRVSADDYYSRNSILYVDVESLAELNVYLPSENETVVFDQFALTDNTGSYDEGECIVRLDKPLTDGTDTVFSSYFDFDGVASTYLIATDQYILYIETPDRTISYGWLSPDSDGVIDIIISNTPVGEIEEWLNYSLTHDDYGVISLSYESNLELDSVDFWVNATNGTNLYTASSLSDAGSFTYTGSNDSTYYASFSALSESGKTVSITRVITFTGSGVQDDILNFLPEDAPDWLYNLIGGSIVVISVLMFGQFRMDVGCVIGAALTGLFWYWGLLQITGIVVAVGVIIAVAAVLSRSRRS